MSDSLSKSAIMVVAVLVVGLLAGLYVGTGLAQHSNLVVGYTPWVIRQQAEVGLFKNFMPQFGYAAVILPALAATVTVGPRRWLFALAALMIAATLISTSLGELPLNKLVNGWDPRVPVSGWEAMRLSWMRSHWIKTTLSVLSFVAATTALSRR